MACGVFYRSWPAVKVWVLGRRQVWANCKPRSDCFFRVCTVCHFFSIIWTHYCVVKLHYSNFIIITALIESVPIFRNFTVIQIKGLLRTKQEHHVCSRHFPYRCAHVCLSLWHLSVLNFERCRWGGGWVSLPQHWRGLSFCHSIGEDYLRFRFVLLILFTVSYWLFQILNHLYMYFLKYWLKLVIIPFELGHNKTYRFTSNVCICLCSQISRCSWWEWSQCFFMHKVDRSDCMFMQADLCFHWSHSHVLL